MKTPKPGTYVLKSTHAKLRKDVNDTNIFAKKQMLLKIDAENDYREMRNKFVAIEAAYAKQSETLNDLSLSYNQLVEEHSKLKENFSFIGNQSTKYFKEKQELISELEQVKSDYLKATNAFVKERKQHKKDFKAVVIWAVINMVFAVSEICYITYLLIK